MGLRMLLVFLFGLLSKGETPVNLCENGTTQIYDDNLKLDAIGPSISPLTTNISTSCSCVINTTNSSNKVSVKFSQKTKGKGDRCKENKYDEATLVLTSGTDIQPLTLKNEELSNYDKEHEDLSAIELNITINSICGLSYTIRLKEKSRDTKLSHVTCSNPKIVVTSSSTTASTTALKPTDVSKNDMSSTYSLKESSTSSVVENNTSAPSQRGLIVGVVVGVGVGLLLLGVIILAVFIFRRRRAKPQPLTYANRNAPTENSSEPAVSYETLDTYTQIQTGILYDNLTPATDPLADENNQNYYSVVQGFDNNAFHPFDAVPSNDQPSSSGEVENFVLNSIDDMDTTVIENDLYE